MTLPAGTDDVLGLEVEGRGEDAVVRVVGNGRPFDVIVAEALASARAAAGSPARRRRRPEVAVDTAPLPLAVAAPPSG